MGIAIGRLKREYSQQKRADRAHLIDNLQASFAYRIPRTLCAGGNRASIHLGCATFRKAWSKGRSGRRMRGDDPSRWEEQKRKKILGGPPPEIEVVHGTASTIYHPTFCACARRVLAVSASFVDQPVCQVPERTSTASPIRVRVSSLVSQSVSHRSLLDPRAAASSPPNGASILSIPPSRSQARPSRTKKSILPVLPALSYQLPRKSSISKVVRVSDIRRRYFVRWQFPRTHQRFRRSWTIDLTRRGPLAHLPPASVAYRVR